MCMKERYACHNMSNALSLCKFIHTRFQWASFLVASGKEIAYVQLLSHFPFFLFLFLSFSFPPIFLRGIKLLDLHFKCKVKDCESSYQTTMLGMGAQKKKLFQLV